MATYTLRNGLPYRRVLVAVAHYDDEVLGCGGTLARFAAEGAAVLPVIFAHPRNGDPVGEEELADYQRTAQVAARRLGILEPRLFEYPEEKMGEYVWGIMRSLERVCLAFKPDLIISHAADDIHQDHRAVRAAVDICARPFASESMLALWAMEVPGSSALSFTPNLWVTLNDAEVSRRQDAYAAYCAHAAIARAAPHPRSQECLDGRSAFRGGQIGARHAEPFSVQFSIG